MNENKNKLFPGSFYDIDQDVEYSVGFSTSFTAVDRYTIINQYGPIFGEDRVYSDVLSNTALFPGNIYFTSKFDYEFIKNKLVLDERFSDEFKSVAKIDTIKVKIPLHWDYNGRKISNIFTRSVFYKELSDEYFSDNILPINYFNDFYETSLEQLEYQLKDIDNKIFGIRLKQAEYVRSPFFDVGKDFSLTQLSFWENRRAHENNEPLTDYSPPLNFSFLSNKIIMVIQKLIMTIYDAFDDADKNYRSQMFTHLLENWFDDSFHDHEELVEKFDGYEVDEEFFDRLIDLFNEFESNMNYLQIFGFNNLYDWLTSTNYFFVNGTKQAIELGIDTLYGKEGKLINYPLLSHQELVRIFSETEDLLVKFSKALETNNAALINKKMDIVDNINFLKSRNKLFVKQFHSELFINDISNDHNYIKSISDEKSRELLKEGFYYYYTDDRGGIKHHFIPPMYLYDKFSFNGDIELKFQVNVESGSFDYLRCEYIHNSNKKINISELIHGFQSWKLKLIASIFLFNSFTYINNLKKEGKDYSIVRLSINQSATITEFDVIKEPSFQVTINDSGKLSTENIANSMFYNGNWDVSSFESEDYRKKLMDEFSNEDPNSNDFDWYKKIHELSSPEGIIDALKRIFQLFIEENHRLPNYEEFSKGVWYTRTSTYRTMWHYDLKPEDLNANHHYGSIVYAFSYIVKAPTYDEKLIGSIFPVFEKPNNHSDHWYVRLSINEKFARRIFNFLVNNNYALIDDEPISRRVEVKKLFEMLPNIDKILKSELGYRNVFVPVLIVQDKNWEDFINIFGNEIRLSHLETNNSRGLFDNFVTFGWKYKGLEFPVNGIPDFQSISYRLSHIMHLSAVFCANKLRFSSKDIEVIYFPGINNQFFSHLLSSSNLDSPSSSLIISSSIKEKGLSFSVGSLINIISQSKSYDLEGRLYAGDTFRKNQLTGQKKFIVDFDQSRWDMTSGDVSDDTVDSAFFVDELSELGNFLDHLFSFFYSDTDFLSDMVIDRINKLVNFELMSIEQLDYIKSAKFMSEWIDPVNGKEFMDRQGYVNSIMEHVDSLEDVAISQFSNVISVTINDFKKLVGSYNSLINMDKDQAVRQLTETEEWNAAYSKINDQFENMINDFESYNTDTERIPPSSNIIKSKLDALLVRFDLSLRDPFLILLTWKDQVKNRLELFEFNSPNTKKVSSFKKLLERITLPNIDFSQIATIINQIFSKAIQMVPRILERTVKALAVYDNIVNIIEIIRFPYKVLPPKVGKIIGDENNNYIILPIPRNLTIHRSFLKNGRYHILNELSDGIFPNLDAYFSKIYVPEINLFLHSLIIKVKNQFIEGFIDHANSIVKRNDLSELSKFFSIIYSTVHHANPQITHGENAIIAGIISAQATIAAGTAFSSGGSLIDRAISAGIAAATTIAANAYAAISYNSSRTINMFSFFRNFEDSEKDYMDFQVDEEVLVTPIRTLSVIPLTPAYIAGKVMLQVVAIGGAFAFSAAIGKFVGSLGKTLNSSMKLLIKKKDLVKQQKKLKEGLSKELSKIDKEVDRTIKERSEYSDLSDSEKKKIRKELIAEKKKTIKEKYSREQGGLINFNRAQIIGAAKYQLYLDDNGFKPSQIGNIISSATKGVSKSAIAAIGVTSAIAGGTISALVKPLVKKNNDVKKKDNYDNHQDSGSEDWSNFGTY